MFCIENINLVFIIISLCILLFISYMYVKQLIIKQQNDLMYIKKNNYEVSLPNNNIIVEEKNVFNDPYMPPIKHNHYLKNNIITQYNSHYNFDYKQIGILNRQNGKETILPLFGRPLHSNRNKWQYYSMTDKNHMVKIPISKNGKSCTNEYGCNELYDGDLVHAEGYNDIFKITIYDNY